MHESRVLQREQMKKCAHNREILQSVKGFGEMDAV